MILVAIMPSQNVCMEVGVPLGSWSSCCPNCRHELRVSLTADKCHSPGTPPPFTIQPYLPPYSMPVTAQVSPYNDELKRLAETLRALRLSGWYYGNMDWQTGRKLLKDAGVGAFIIRDSGDRNYIFALTVQTEKGPTSVRLHYEQGFFRLDCAIHLAKYMPRFRCVLELVQHYTRIGVQNSASTVWVDREGCPHSPVLLKNPMRKNPPSLMHAARLAIHKALDVNPHTPKLWLAPRHRLLLLPSALIDYLGEYPYSI